MNTKWTLPGTALLAFAAGSLVTAHVTHVQSVRADSHRIYELNVYHAVPGKVPALEARFEDASNY